MAKEIRNILFIMYDQLRHDYLGCTGHPFLKTPNMDWLASQGVRFSNCYVQSPICGSSRMSTYTGRYVHSHGAQRNNFPLKVGEQTMGDHLRKIGMECWLIGKTHMMVDSEGLSRLGIAEDGVIGARLSECGFDIHTRDDGLWAEGPDGFYDEKRSPYNEYLKAKGYGGDNPWGDFANAGAVDGDIASGWFMRHADKPANIKNEDSETPWLTRQAIDFMEGKRGAEVPWLAHVSYIKPHWPYIVPAPYHDMYGPNQVKPVVRDVGELDDPHPVYHAFMSNPIGQAFSRDEVRAKVIPTYMGLIKQCDDELGNLLDYMRESGALEDTLIVLTSDHGDYLGDHWLGEKDLFHDPSVKVPLIIFDPTEAADGTRGTVCDALCEAIDLIPTFVEAKGGEIPDHILEGRSLLPFLHGEPPEEWRDFAVSEYDFSSSGAANALGLAPRDARLFMIVDHKWKFIHSEGGFRPLLFDLENDPQELVDLGGDAGQSEVIDLMYQRLGAWARRLSQRTAISDKTVRAMRKGSNRQGILLGVFDEGDVPAELSVKYRRKVPGVTGRAADE